MQFLFHKIKDLCAQEEADADAKSATEEHLEELQRQLQGIKYNISLIYIKIIDIDILKDKVKNLKNQMVAAQTRV